MSDKIERPAFVTNKHLTYLDDLRESGRTNMYGAGSYLSDSFPAIDRANVTKILRYWMDTFGKDER